MSYDTPEASEEDGAPLELYLFSRGNTEWRYTSSETDIGDDSNAWVSHPIQRTEIETAPDQERNAIRLVVPRNNEVADLFRIAAPTDVIALTIFRYHRGQDSDTIVLWMGRVLNVEFSGARATINCEPISRSLGRTGLRRHYQLSCPHVLYGTACGVDKTLFATEATVTNVSGLSLEVSGLESHSYAGGFVEWVTGGNTERRFIRSVSGSTLTLSQPFQGIEVGADVTVYPGCDHTMQTCDAQFDNILNYGGFPFIPQKNPFDGNPVY